METQRRSVKALIVDASLCALWGLFAYLMLKGWVQTRKPLGLGLFLVNTTYAYVFIARRPAMDCSTLPKDWFVTVATIVLSFSLGVGLVEGHVPVLTYVSVAVQCIATTALFVSVCSLGRSFGLVPANRGVKVKGMYAYVRHPLYASQLLFYCAFILGHFSPRSLAVLIGIFLGLYLRAKAEEKFLSKDPLYEEYLRTVRYRFMPGII